jgi:phosphate uptake regulator
MESRKLIQHGLSSLTLSLPNKWIREYNLKKGDSVFVKEEGKNIVISTDKKIDHGKIDIEVTNLDRTSLLLYIQSLYRYGYDEININFKNQIIIHHRSKKEVTVSSVLHKIVNRLIGAEIINQTENFIQIKYITKETEEDFQILLRRIFLLMKETSLSLIEGIDKKNFSLLETIEEKHDIVNKFINYCLRLINKYGYSDVKKTYYYFHIIASIDKILDILKYIARDIIKKKESFSKNAIEIQKKIHKSIELYYDLFYQFSFLNVNKLSENRDSVKFSLVEKSEKLSRFEIIQLTSSKQILEIILDLTDFKMGLEN